MYVLFTIIYPYRHIYSITKCIIFQAFLKKNKKADIAPQCLLFLIIFYNYQNTFLSKWWIPWVYLILLYYIFLILQYFFTSCFCIFLPLYRQKVLLVQFRLYFFLKVLIVLKRLWQLLAYLCFWLKIAC